MYRNHFKPYTNIDQYVLSAPSGGVGGVDRIRGQHAASHTTMTSSSESSDSSELSCTAEESVYIKIWSSSQMIK